LKAVLLQELNDTDEREHAARVGRPPVLGYPRNKLWDTGRHGWPACGAGWRNDRATNRDLKKKGSKRGKVRTREPPFARKPLNCARVQPGQTEVRALNSPFRIEEDVARFQTAVQQPEAVGEPKTKRNSCKPLSPSLSASTTPAEEKNGLRKTLTREFETFPLISAL
jgi:hypothetical protein